MATKKLGVPVTERALIQRINRVLAKDEEVLKVTRGERWRGDLGNYYTVNFNSNAIAAQHIDLEKFGRECGVLKPWERLVDE